MDKTEKYEVMAKRTTHNFYCDECGMFLGKSEEYDDGWYPEIGEYRQKMFVQDASNSSGHWYRMHKNLCSKCAAELDHLNANKTTL